MKKIILLAGLTMLGFGACQHANESAVEEQSKIDMSDFYAYSEEEDGLLGKSNNSRNCHSMRVLNQKLD